MLGRRTKRTVVVAALCCAVAANAEPSKRPKAAPKPRLQVSQAYFAGQAVKFKPATVKNAHALAVGPWDLGPKVSPEPNDKRPNLYFVVPGSQEHFENHPEFDHNIVISAVTDGEESGFDVFWVVVLDPLVHTEFTSEQQIIMATQTSFTPSPGYTIHEAPSAGFLKSFLKISDLHGLDKFRRPDGGLPRVAIIRAKLTVKAVTEELDQPRTNVADSKEKTPE